MNLVVGATGLVGGEICNQLKGTGRPVRALVRSSGNAARKERLSSLGIEMVVGDVKDRSSLNTACQATQTVISTASSMISRGEGDNLDTVDLKGQMNLIDAAYAAGVSHFIYISFSGGIEGDFPLKTAKRTVEEYLKGSGLAYTILRPTFFMEIWLSPHIGFDYSNARAQVYGEGNKRISWISLVDVARFAVATFDNPQAHNSVLELGGPDALSPLEVIRIFEEVGGKKFVVQHVPEDALQVQKANALDPMQQTFAGLMLSYAHGDPINTEETLQQFPLRLASVRDYARRVMK